MSGVESKSECKEGINTPCQNFDMVLGDESIITTISEDPCEEANIVTVPITGKVNRECMLGENSSMDFE